MRDLWYLRMYLRPYWKALVLALLVMGISGGLSALALARTQPVFEGVLGEFATLPDAEARARMDDLVGACLGALAVSVALLPALGILETCAFLVVLKVGSLALVMTMDGFIPSTLKKPRHRSAE